MKTFDIVSLDVNMNAEVFLDALDAAACGQDREALAALGNIAFERRNLLWQAAVRHADNYVLAGLQQNSTLQQSCQDSFMTVVTKIRAQNL